MDENTKAPRRQVLVHRPVQVTLVLRVVLHWLALLTVVVLALPLARIVVQGDLNTPFHVQAAQAASDALLLVLIFVALLPYFIYDTFRTTNRFAGPMVRLHRTIRELAAGAPFQPVHFRKDDFWHEVADDFNRLEPRLTPEANEHDSAQPPSAATGQHDPACETLAS